MRIPANIIPAPINPAPATTTPIMMFLLEFWLHNSFGMKHIPDDPLHVP